MGSANKIWKLNSSRGLSENKKYGLKIEHNWSINWGLNSALKANGKGKENKN